MRQGLRVKVDTGTPPANTASPEPAGGLWMPSLATSLSSTVHHQRHLLLLGQRLLESQRFLWPPPQPTAPRGPPLCLNSDPHLAWGSLGLQFPCCAGAPWWGRRASSHLLPSCRGLCLCAAPGPGGGREAPGWTSCTGAPPPSSRGGVGHGCGLRGPQVGASVTHRPSAAFGCCANPAPNPPSPPVTGPLFVPQMELQT